MTSLRDLGKPLALVVVAPAIPLGMEPEPFDRRPVLDELARALQGLPPLGEWIESAACADLGGGADVFTEDHPDVEELALAEAVCWRCAVLAECRGYASQTTVYGLWGAEWHGTKAKRRQAA